jgi:hypothetical protein
MAGFKVVLGADPEFELVRVGRSVGVAGLWERDIALPWGIIGRDGELLELRPRPSTNPEQLVRNLGRLLLSVPKVVEGVPSTACKTFSIGGHVHIGGVPEGMRRDLAQVLDEGLGDLFYSLSAETRLEAGYGKRGDWRPQPWGVEYRTPPASVWSHPEVALTFLRAIKWVAKRFLNRGNPFGDPVWPVMREAAEKAAEFVKAHEGHLHWGAWRAYIGEGPEVWGELEVEISLGPDTEHDEAFLEDLRGMCARLGMPTVRVIPLHRKRGEFATNVPGYGEVVKGFEPYKPGGAFALSWRFRNDPEFRRTEMPELERAIARILEAVEEGDGGLLVKEAVPFSAEWRPEGEVEEVEEEPRAPEEYVRCDRCGSSPRSSEDYRARLDRYEEEEEEEEEEFVPCRRCGREVLESDVYYDESGRSYCEECYYELYATCAGCGQEVLVEEARVDEVGHVYCEACYEDLYTSCTRCGREVAWDEVEEHDDLTYCPSCHASVASEDEEAVLQE